MCMCDMVCKTRRHKNVSQKFLVSLKTTQINMYSLVKKAMQSKFLR